MSHAPLTVRSVPLADAENIHSAMLRLAYATMPRDTPLATILLQAAAATERVIAILASSDRR